MIRIIKTLLWIPEGSTGKREVAAAAFIWSQFMFFWVKDTLESSDLADLVFWNIALSVAMVLAAFGFQALLNSPLIEKLAGLRSGRSNKSKNADYPDDMGGLD